MNRKYSALFTVLFVLLVLVLLAVLPVTAEEWNLDLATGVLTISGEGETTDYSNGSFAPWYDQKESITSVVVMPGITRIGNYAFYGLERLTDVTLPDTVTEIGKRTFSTCTALTGITIPDSVTYLDSYAFAGCTGLKELTLPDGLVTIGPYVFSECSGLKSISIPDTVIGIGTGGFYRCTSLESVVIPDSVTYINSACFYGNSSLRYLVISKSVTTILEYAFDWCEAMADVFFVGDEEDSLVFKNSFQGDKYYTIHYCTSYPEKLYSVSLLESSGGSVKINGTLFASENPVELTLSAITAGWEIDCVLVNGKEVKGTVFHVNEDTAVEVVFTKKCDTKTGGLCGSWASWYLDGENVLHISGLGKIYDLSATSRPPWYSSRTKIKSVVIGEGITGIPDTAFSNCTQMSSVTLPKSVAVIGESAFSGCTGLKDVYYGGRSDMWNKVTISGSNAPLTNASLHCDESAVDSYEPEIVNYTKGSASAVLENKGKTAVVTCGKACSVLAKTGENTYVRLIASKRKTGVYAFDLSGITGEFSLIVALRGDANLDGYINSTDLGQARGVMSKKLVPDKLKELVMDLKVDGLYNSTDLGQLRAVMSGKLELEW